MREKAVLTLGVTRDEHPLPGVYAFCPCVANAGEHQRGCLVHCVLRNQALAQGQGERVVVVPGRCEIGCTVGGGLLREGVVHGNGGQRCHQLRHVTAMCLGRVSHGVSLCVLYQRVEVRGHFQAAVYLLAQCKAAGPVAIIQRHVMSFIPVVTETVARRETLAGDCLGTKQQHAGAFTAGDVAEHFAHAFEWLSAARTAVDALLGCGAQTLRYRLGQVVAAAERTAPCRRRIRKQANHADRVDIPGGHTRVGEGLFRRGGRQGRRWCEGRPGVACQALHMLACTDDDRRIVGQVQRIAWHGFYSSLRSSSRDSRNSRVAST